MKELDKNITLLIIAQLNNTASQAELNKLEQWLESNPSNREKYSEIKTLVQKKPLSHTEEEIELAFSGMEKKLFTKPNKLKENTEGRKVKFPIKTIIAIAASVIIAVVIYQWAGDYWVNNNSVAIITKECPKGQKLHLSLSDGTEVWLNSDSRITFPELFAESNRSINLEGEAFFNVTKNKEKPFIVNTSNSEIKVLGTSFNVKNNNSITETTVVSGKVLVSSTFNTQSVSLIKNQYAVVNSTGELSKIDNINHESIIDWKDNNLFFDDVLLSEVFREIEPWFDIKIQVEDESITQRKLRAKFSNPSLNQLLGHISSVMDIDYQIEGKTVIILKTY